GERGSRILELVELAPHHRVGNNLKHQQKNETWDGQVNQIRNLWHQRMSVAQRSKILPLITLIAIIFTEQQNKCVDSFFDLKGVFCSHCNCSKPGAMLLMKLLKISCISVDQR